MVQVRWCALQRPLLISLLWLAGWGTVVAQAPVPESVAPAAPEAPVSLADVLVTAAKRQESVQEVSLSLSVLNASQLAAAGVHDLRQAAALVPNLAITGFTPRRTAYPFMRGLGAGQGDPAVTLVVDGVPQLTSSTFDAEYPELERLEFIRGPQGTLYGRNTLGGVVNVVTRRPGAEWGGRVGAEFGNAELQRYELSLHGPVVRERAWLGLSGVFTDREGYTRNDVTGHWLDSRQTVAGRGELLVVPAPEVELRLSLRYERDREGDYTLYDVAALRRDPWTVRHDYEGRDDRNLTSPALTLTVSGETVEFVSVSAYEQWDGGGETDLDFTERDLLRQGSYERQHEFYQELRLQSPTARPWALGDGLALHWLAGASFCDSAFTHRSTTEYRPTLTTLPISLYDTARYRLDDRGFGLFGQTTLTIAQKNDLTFGLRREWERRQADVHLLAQSIAPPNNVTNTEFTDSFSQWLPRFGLARRWTEQFTTYGSAAEGYRAGGYNRNVTPGGPLTYEAERSWTYELGAKTAWWERRLTLNAAVFYIDWDNMQLDVPIAALPGRYYLDNAGQARSHGCEVEAQAKLSPAWTATAGFGYTDAQFREYTDPGTGADAAGNRLPWVPRFTWTAALEHEIPLWRQVQFFVRGELTGSGDRWFDTANTLAQDDYLLTNARTGLRTADWEAALWVRNAFNQDYLQVAMPSNFSPSGFAGVSGPPRTWGIALTYRF